MLLQINGTVSIHVNALIGWKLTTTPTDGQKAVFHTTTVKALILWLLIRDSPNSRSGQITVNSG